MQPEPLVHDVFGGLRREHAWEPLRVEGALPPALRGTLYRNGPAQFVKGRRSHWFDGRGAVTAVRFEGGTARGAVRLVDTPAVAEDHASPQPKWSGFQQKMNWSVRLRALLGANPVANFANINVLPWRQRLFALYETCPPLEIDPETLASQGETSLDGALKGSWNAHPHYSPERRAWYQFGVRPGPRVFLDVYELPDSGAARLLTSVRLPGLMELHDFAVTPNWLIFVIPPLWASALGPLIKGSFCDSLVWRPREGSRILAIPIDRPDEPVRIETDSMFFWHHAQAVERADSIEIDLFRYPDFASNHAWLESVCHGGTGGKHGSEYWRLKVQPRQKKASWERLWSHPCEFGFVPAGSHHAWMAGWAAEHEGLGFWDRLIRLDLETGSVLRLQPSRRGIVGEPVVVPRAGEEPLILSLTHDLDAGETYLAVWDCARPEEPLARVWFGQQLPLSLHGAWAPAA